MARDRKFLLEFQTDVGVFYKIEVFDNDSSDSTQYTPNLGDDGFSLTYQTDTDNRFTGLIPSEVKFDMFLENDAQRAVVSSIQSADYGQFDVGIYKSTDDSSYDLYWAGVILNDVSNEKDVDYPQRVTLTAIDGLAALKDKPFNEGVAYTTPSSFQIIAYFLNAFRLQITWTNNYIAADENLITTRVNWSTDSAGFVSHRDPLNFSRFNFMAFVDVNEDDGTKKYKDAFFLLDSICKSFCARCFFSEGTWQIVSVNNYHINSSVDPVTGISNFFRRYLNSSSVNPDSNGVQGLIIEEGPGTSYKRFGADFGMLPVLKEVKGQYAHLTPFDMPFISYNNNSDTSTDYEFSSNEIPIWNGYRFNNVNYTGSNYGFNLASSDKLIIDLGSVAAITGSSISINRDFLFSTTGDLNFSDVSGQNMAVKVKLALRFRLVGNSGTTHYWLLSENNDTWFTNDIHPITQEIGPALDWYNFNFGNNNINVNLQTTELPDSGQLFFEAYAKCFYNNFASVPSNISEIEILNTTSTIDPTKILVYSPPENDETQGIKYLLNNEVISSKFFIANNAPGGTIINDGAKLELDESFFGTGPTSGAVGRLETFNFTTSSFDDGTNATWKAYGTGTGVEFTQLQVNQVLKGQMQGAKILNSSLKITNKAKPYDFLKGIKIDSINYAPYQVTYNANQEVWSGVWYEIDLSTDTQTTSNGIISNIPVANEFTPTLDNFVQNESIGVTSSDTTSLTLTFINIIPSTTSTEKIIKSGDVVNVICADTGALKQFTANADVNYGSTRLQFASTTVDQIIPAGSVLMMNREKKFERTHSSLQHIVFSSQAATQAEWTTVSSSGISNHTWNTVTTDKGFNVGTSQLTNVSTAIQSVGIVVPFDCTLIGIRAIIYRVGNFQTAVGLFCGTPAYNDNATQDFTLRAYAAADNSAGPDSNYSQRPVKAEDLTRSHSLSAGDVIIPAFNSVSDDGGNARITYTIVLKTLELL
tara:strand:- start:3834 stop:6785 length:2952 start_codon:yes stop_codon:yes gene_type:complete